MKDTHEPTYRHLCEVLGLTESELSALAAKHKVENKRNRCILWWQFLWVSIFALLNGGSRHSDRARLFKKWFGRLLSTNAFSDWLSRFQTAFFADLVTLVSAKLAGVGSLKQKQKRKQIVNALRIEDSSWFQGNRRLRHLVGTLPGQELKAGLKLFLGLTVHGEFAASTARVKPGRCADVSYTSKPRKGTVQLRDRGWFSMPLFTKWVNEGRHFISRIQKSFNPLVTEVFQGDSSWVKRNLQALNLTGHKEIHLKIRPWRGKDCVYRLNTKEPLQLDLFGKYMKGKWYWYVAYLPNLEDESLTFADVHALYTTRWRIEEAFREMKSGFQCRIQRLSNPTNAINQIYLMVLTWLISQAVFRAVAHKRRRSANGFRLDNVLKGSGREQMAELFYQIATTGYHITKSMNELIDQIMAIGYSEKRARSPVHRNQKAALRKLQGA